MILTLALVALAGCKKEANVVQSVLFTNVPDGKLTLLVGEDVRVKYIVEPVEGELIDNGTQSAGIVAGNVVIPVTSTTSTAQFEVSPEQFELLKNGIVKIRLTTIPLEHEREFKKDKIGRKLYQFYLDAKNKDDQF